MPADQPTPAPVVSGALAYAVQGDIYVADPDGSNAVKIVDSAADEACTGAGAHWSNEVPSWSPDGKYLAFYHDCSTSEQENVIITDPHGNVVTEFPRDMWGFEWSPDSTPSRCGERGGGGSRSTASTVSDRRRCPCLAGWPPIMTPARASGCLTARHFSCTACSWCRSTGAPRTTCRWVGRRRTRRTGPVSPGSRATHHDPRRLRFARVAGRRASGRRGRMVAGRAAPGFLVRRRAQRCRRRIRNRDGADAIDGGTERRRQVTRRPRVLAPGRPDPVRDRRRGRGRDGPVEHRRRRRRRPPPRRRDHPGGMAIPLIEGVPR